MKNKFTITPRTVILMGVSGSGKTTIGKKLSQKVGWEYIEGDEHHPAVNIHKMSNGIPLDDNDRFPWLMKLHDIISEYISREDSLVLSCSALKEKYRRILTKENSAAVFVYLRGSYDVIHSRMQTRRGHYMKQDMLKSQFDALEEPADAICIDIDRDVDSIVQDIIDRLGIG